MSVIQDLIIDPGVVVRGVDGGSFTFDDVTIRAVGTVADSIVFQSISMINLGSCDRNWVMTYCTFTQSSGMHLYCVQPRSDTVAHCAFRGSQSGFRLFVHGSYNQTKVLIQSCVFSDFPSGLEVNAMGVSHAHVRIEDNLFPGTENGLKLYYCDAEVYSNRFVNQSVQSIYVVSSSSNVVTIGGAPDRCNTFCAPVGFNCIQGMSLDARYNYWGTNDTAVIAHTMLQCSQGTIQYLPITNDHCQPVTSFDAPAAEQILHVQVYPVPVSSGSTINVLGGTAQPVRYELYDLNGALIWYKETDEASPAFPSTPAGVYLLRARQSETFGFTKVAVK